MPIDHVKLPISDLDASRAFYTAALASLGWKLVWDEAPTLRIRAR
jgi:catechol 2,3-dioxygenase-like lactoylglutathione lyase family enzyme